MTAGVAWLQIIVKEKGVFSNVTSPSTKAKLRLLFEVAPLALLVSYILGKHSSCHHHVSTHNHIRLLPSVHWRHRWLSLAEQLNDVKPCSMILFGLMIACTFGTHVSGLQFVSEV